MSASEATPGLQAWLADKIPGASDVHVTGSAMKMVGWSAETSFINVQYRDKDGEHEETLVVRGAPIGIGLLEPYRLDAQFRILEGLSKTDVPVPEARWLEEDTSFIGRRFYIMSQVPGVSPEFAPLAFRTASPDEQKRFHRDLLSQLAAINTADWEGIGIDCFPDGGNFARDVLAQWTGDLEEIDDKLNHRFEAMWTLQRWLSKNQPGPNERLGLVHGDCKWGNFLWDDGKISSVLDWEMSAIGDPIADLAYHLVYETGNDSLKMLPNALAVDEIIEYYTELTGFTIDPDELKWWQAMMSFKLTVIMLRAHMLFATGESSELKYSLGVGSAQGFIDRATDAAGIDRLEIGDIPLRHERIAEACADVIQNEVLPALGEQPTQAALAMLLLRQISTGVPAYQIAMQMLGGRESETQEASEPVA